MSRAEDLFQAEANLRSAAVVYAHTRSGSTTDKQELEVARRRLREAAINYANEADDLDALVHPDEVRS